MNRRRRPELFLQLPRASALDLELPPELTRSGTTLTGINARELEIEGRHLELCPSLPSRCSSNLGLNQEGFKRYTITGLLHSARHALYIKHSK